MKTLHVRTASSIFGLVGLAVLAPAPVFAQSNEAVDNAPIIVTAQRREEKQLDVPITVNTISQEALQAANLQNLSDITKLAPAVRFDFASGFYQPTIRGVGTAVVTAGGGSNVGIYIDGFYSPNALANDFQLSRIRNIQVLKGPQGTLFGRNTTGGAILVQTADPSTTPSAEAKASYGRFGEFKAQAYATMGISDRVALDAEGIYSSGDGYLTNISNNNDKVGKYENWTVRLGLKAELSDSVSVLLRYQHNQVDDPTPTLTSGYRETKPSYKGLNFVIANGAPFYSVPGEYTFNRREIASGSAPADFEYFRANGDTVQLTVKADLGFGDLTSYSQYRKEVVDSSIEIDYSGNPTTQLGLPNDNETWSQEILLTSKPGSRLQWTAGGFLFQNRDTYIVYLDYAPAIAITSRASAPPFGSNGTVHTAAAFLDATYEVTPKFFILAGARYSHDWVTDGYSQGFLAPINYPTKAQYDAVKSNRVTPRLVLRYKPTESSSVYASFTRGYKAAILDEGPGVPNPVKPETITAYEVGYKYDGGRLSLDLSGFYYDYKNLQVSIYTTASTATIINAASSEIYGLDGQLRYRVSPNFEFNLSGAYTHARYKKFVDAPIYTPCGTFAATDSNQCFNSFLSFPAVRTTITDVPMQRAPQFTGNFGATYKTDLAGGEFRLAGNLYYSSKFWFGPSGIQFPQKGYEVLTLRAQWTDPSDRYTIAVYGDNVTNSKYRTQVQYGQTGIGTNWSKPITYGVEFAVKFD